MRIFLRLPIESLPARSRQAEPAAGERGQSNFTADRDLQEPFVKNSPATLSIARKSALFRRPQMLRASAVWGLFARERIMRRAAITAARIRVIHFQPCACPTADVARADPLRDDA